MTHPIDARASASTFWSRMTRDRLDGVDANRLDAEVLGEDQVLLEGGEERAVVLDADQLLRPQIGGERGEVQAVVD